MSSFDPSFYESQRRGLLRNFSADSAMNSYQRFLSQRRGTRNISDMERGYSEATPRMVASFSRRGLTGPNIRSGVFSQALQKWDADRVRQLSRARESMQEDDMGYELADRSSRSNYEDALLELELDKARRIQDDAMRLMSMRAGY